MWTILRLWLALAVASTAAAQQTFEVTQTGDAGAGSLRQAILDLNAHCASGRPSAPPRCTIAFVINGPVPPAGWFTISPESPLPPIAALDAVIDGSTQSRHSGESNPFGGPEIMLDGSRLRTGDGLQVQGRSTTISDLAIGFFPGNGIYVQASRVSGDTAEAPPVCTVRRAYLGVDPTGNRAAPNGLRGLQSVRAHVFVDESVLSANRRAGAFLFPAAGSSIKRSHIGVGADGLTPLGNGASGIFFHDPAQSLIAALVPAAEKNVIAYNGHAGIAISAGTMAEIGANRIHDNAEGAIDVGLDGPSPASSPRVTSARYENGVTVIEGTTPADVLLYDEVVFIYANRTLDARGHAEAEEFLGSVRTVRTTGSSSFRLVVSRDLRGLWVNAARFTYRHGSPPVACICDIPEKYRFSSELGLPRRVQ